MGTIITVLNGHYTNARGRQRRGGGEGREEDRQATVDRAVLA